MKVESSIRQIDYPQQSVYNMLSNLDNIEKVRDKIPQEQVENLEFDHDSVSIKTQIGSIRLVVVNRTEPKEIKFETTDSPVPFNVWIQILPVTETTSKMKLTAKADLNPFMAGMIKKQLQDAIEKIADVLQMIQYE